MRCWNKCKETMALDCATRPHGAAPEVSAPGKAPWLGFEVQLLHRVTGVPMVPHRRGGGGWFVSRPGQGSGWEGCCRCSAAPRDAWVLGTVALAWRPAVGREGIYHGHESGIHHRHGYGICQGHEQGISHGHTHGMGTDTASAMGMEVASTMRTDAAATTITRMASLPPPQTPPCPRGRALQEARWPPNP